MRFEDAESMTNYNNPSEPMTRHDSFTPDDSYGPVMHGTTRLSVVTR
jgi:hypothetical protein